MEELEIEPENFWSASKNLRLSKVPGKSPIVFLPFYLTFFSKVATVVQVNAM